MAEKQHTEHAPKVRSKGGSAAPSGDLIAVVGALVLGKMFGAASTPSPGPAAPAQPAPTNAPAGSILSGLTDLIGKLTAGGTAPQAKSWVGQGANEPVQPGQLGSALGENVLNELSQRTGMSQQELLNQLATVLPQLINQLTPDGRMPMLAELEKDDSADPLRWKPDAWGAGYLEEVSTLLGGRAVLGSMIESDLEAHELLHRGLPRY
jgi:uncharacterized protein YidB (DUF937 family)